MDLVHESDGKWRGIVKRYEIDLAFGDVDENDFELRVPEMFARDVDGSLMTYGDYVFFAQTEWGGVIDGMEYDNTGDYPVLTYTGRTWHGILSHKIIRPDAGQDYYTVSGSVKSVLATLISRLGLNDVFQAVDGNSKTFSYTFERYTDAYTGICKMLALNGMRLNVSKGQGLCELSAVYSVDVSQGVDDNFLSIDMRDSRPVNHMVCLGEGQLKDRVVVDLYSDASGKVSKTQTYTGIQEIAEVYDSNNEDADGMTEKGTERLQESFADSLSISAEIPDWIDAHVGDTVTGRSVSVPLVVSATVSTITVKGENGSDPEVSYQVGSVKVL